MSPLERIEALSLVLEQSLQKNRFHEIPALLEARAKAIEQLATGDGPIGGDRLSSILELQRQLEERFAVRRAAALERLAALQSGKKARRAYPSRLTGL